MFHDQRRPRALSAELVARLSHPPHLGESTLHSVKWDSPLYLADDIDQIAAAGIPAEPSGRHEEGPVSRPSEVELNGALSNPLAGLEGPLARLADLVRDVRERPGPARTPRSAPRRSIRVQALVEQIVRDARRPIRVHEVCAAIDGLVAGVDKASVRKTLHDRSRGPDACYRRVTWGLYEWAGR